MVMSSLRACAWLEIAVMLLQVVGVVSLCLSRLAPATRWSERGQTGFVLTMIGLGVAGALCGRHDSEFALFAGGTMTFLLIGMTIGNGHAHTTHATNGVIMPEPNLAG